MCAGDRSSALSLILAEGSTSDGTGACDVEDSACVFTLSLSVAVASEPADI
jgi:hypothetical protein